jgi:hypothetical protein
MNGRSPEGSGYSAEPEPEEVSAVPVSIPNAILDAVADAIVRAECSWREGPYGGFDYGHNPDFYGPEPEGGRYVVRDFRDMASETYGSWVHQTHDKDEHEQAYQRLTRRHIAQAAITAYASAIEAQRAGTPQSGPVHESAVGNAETPNPSLRTITSQGGTR